jgi:hypothetical protein
MNVDPFFHATGTITGAIVSSNNLTSPSSSKLLSIQSPCHTPFFTVVEEPLFNCITTLCFKALFNVAALIITL